MELGAEPYQLDEKFGEKTKTVTICNGRKEPDDKRIPGPGSYKHERSQKQTKKRAPSTFMSPVHARQNVDGTVGPGAYDAGKQFGEDAKAW